MRAPQARHAAAESLVTTGSRLQRGEDDELEPSLASACLGWAEIRACAGDIDGAMDKLKHAVRAHALASEAAWYPGLAALASRPDYPCVNSP